MQEEKNKILKQITKGAGVIFIGTLIGYIINFFYRLIISRYLGPAGYGLISLGQMVLNISLIVAMFGLHEAITHYIAYFKSKKEIAKVKGTFYSALKIIFFVSFFIVIVLILFSNFISQNIFGAPEFKPILIIFILIIPVQAFLRLMGSFFLSLKKSEYKEVTNTIIKNLLNLLFVGIVILLGGNVLHISISYLIAVILAAFISFLIFKYKIYPKLFDNKIKPDYNYKELFSFSFPLLFTGIFLNIMGWADTFFLGFFKDATQVGIYNVAFPLAAAMGMFLTSFGQIFYPLSSELVGERKHELIGKSYEVIIRWIFMLTFPIFLLIIFFPRDILKFLFGRAYISGYIALIILISAYFFNIITGPGIHTLKSFKKLKFIFNLNVGVVLLNIILNISLIPSFGLNGAALATAISIILREFMIFLKVKSLTKFSYDWFQYLKYLMSGVTPLIIIYLVLTKLFRPYSLAELIIALLVFGLFYVSLLLLFKSFSKEDFMIMLTIEKKFNLDLSFVKKIMRRFV